MRRPACARWYVSSVSSLRPTRRLHGPDGREWEIYVYKLRLPHRPAPDPAPFDLGPSLQGAGVSALLDGIVYVLAWIPRLLVRVFIDLPAAAFRAARADEWIVEAISWAPFRASYKWSTTGELRRQVVALVEGALASGETPHPRNARLLELI
jgi:hypothetical protein